MAVFRVTELPALGGRGVRGTPAEFEFSAAGRSLPERPWVFGTEVRHKRTDYPGGDYVTHQMLGPRDKNQTLRGRWDDRYNGAGYALDTMLAFDAMVRRANKVRVSYEQLQWEGYIVDAEFSFGRGAWDIGYEFELSPEHRVGAEDLRLLPPARAAFSAPQLLEAAEVHYEAMATVQASAPQDLIAGDLYQDTGNFLTDIADGIGEVQHAIDVRLRGRGFGAAQGVVDQALETRDALIRIATAFETMKGNAVRMLNILAQVRSDVDMGYRTAVGVLTFDDWAKSMAAEARALLIEAEFGARETRKRATPDILAVIQASKGMSLYALARKFYGDVAMWRAIATRNNLLETTLSGGETIIIPEVVAG